VIRVRVHCTGSRPEWLRARAPRTVELPGAVRLTVGTP